MLLERCCKSICRAAEALRWYLVRNAKSKFFERVYCLGLLQGSSCARLSVRGQYLYSLIQVLLPPLRGFDLLSSHAALPFNTLLPSAPQASC